MVLIRAFACRPFHVLSVEFCDFFRVLNIFCLALPLMFFSSFLFLVRIHVRRIDGFRLFHIIGRVLILSIHIVGVLGGIF